MGSNENGVSDSQQPSSTLPIPQSNTAAASMTSVESDPTLAPTDYEKGGKISKAPSEKEKNGSVRSSASSEKIEVDSNLEANQSSSEDEIEYPTQWKLTMITIALCLVIFLVALDQTIIATAIPQITNDFKSLQDIGWYGSSYMLTMCSFQLLYGKIYTFFSLKWMFLLAVAIFELGSLVCGVAPTSEALIVGRAVAGLGSAGIFSGALIILAHSVPLHQRPLYTGLIGGMFGIASVAGPLLGGVFTDSESLTWRWCFYINLPIGAVTIILIALLFTPPHRKKVDGLTFKEKMSQFDFIGTFFLLPTIVCLLLALVWGGTEYQWSNWRIILLFCLSGVLAIIFAYIQITSGENATLPIRLLKQRTVIASSLIALCVGAAFFILVFEIPIWFQAIQGVSATQSGIRNLPLILAVTLFSIFSGAIVTVLGYYVPFMIVGPAIAAVATGLLTTWTVDTKAGGWIGYQILAGAGIGLVMQQPMIAAQTALKLEDVPTGTAIVVFSQTFGGALFISVAQNVFANQLVKNIIKNVPNFDPMTVLRVGATELVDFVSKDDLPKILVAYNDALVYTFWPSLALFVFAFFCGFFPEWISVRGKKIEMAAA